MKQLKWLWRREPRKGMIDMRDDEGAKLREQLAEVDRERSEVLTRLGTATVDRAETAIATLEHRLDELDIGRAELLRAIGRAEADSASAAERRRAIDEAAAQEAARRQHLADRIELYRGWAAMLGKRAMVREAELALAAALREPSGVDPDHLATLRGRLHTAGIAVDAGALVVLETSVNGDKLRAEAERYRELADLAGRELAGATVPEREPRHDAPPTAEQLVGQHRAKLRMLNNVLTGARRHLQNCLINRIGSTERNTEHEEVLAARAAVDEAERAISEHQAAEPRLVVAV